MVDGPASTPPSVCGASVTHCEAAAHVEAAAAHDCVADAHDEHWSEHEATAGALQTVARWLQMSVHEVLAPALDELQAANAVRDTTKDAKSVDRVFILIDTRQHALLREIESIWLPNLDWDRNSSLGARRHSSVGAGVGARVGGRVDGIGRGIATVGRVPGIYVDVTMGIDQGIGSRIVGFVLAERVVLVDTRRPVTGHQRHRDGAAGE